MTQNLTSQNIVGEIENLEVAEAREVFVAAPSGNLLSTKRYQAIWNLTTNHLACISSDKYKIIQHRAVVQALFEAIQNLNIQFDYKIKTQEHRLFLDISFPQSKLCVAKGEEFIAGLRLINSFNRTTGLLILPRLCRLICMNGMVTTTFVKGYSIRHTQKLTHDLENVIEKMLNDLINSNDKFNAMVNDCIADSVEWKYAEIVLKNLAISKKHSLVIRSLLDAQKAENQGNSLSRWQIYNAITQFCTHGSQLKPSVENLLQKKAQKLLTTKLEALATEEPIEVMVN